MFNPNRLRRATLILYGIGLLKQLPALNDHHSTCNIDIHFARATLRIPTIDPNRLVNRIRDDTIGLRRHVRDTAIPCIRSAIKKGRGASFQKQRCRICERHTIHRVDGIRVRVINADLLCFDWFGDDRDHRRLLSREVDKGSDVIAEELTCRIPGCLSCNRVAHFSKIQCRRCGGIHFGFNTTHSTKSTPTHSATTTAKSASTPGRTAIG